MSRDSAGVGVPGLFHGLVPGQGLTLLLSPYFIFSQFKKYFVQKITKQKLSWLHFGLLWSLQALVDAVSCLGWPSVPI